MKLFIIIISLTLACFASRAFAESLLHPAAVICVNPVSGDETRIPIDSMIDSMNATNCPPGADFAIFEVEQSPGADPVPFEPQQEQQPEVENAPANPP